jgi:hypothetical protein
MLAYSILGNGNAFGEEQSLLRIEQEWTVHAINCPAAGTYSDHSETGLSGIWMVIFRNQFVSSFWMPIYYPISSPIFRMLD